MAAEFTEVLRRLLAHDAGTVTFEGEYVGVRDVALDPKPVQDPLPFYMIGRNDRLRSNGVAKFGNALMAAHGCGRPSASRRSPDDSGVYGARHRRNSTCSLKVKLRLAKDPRGRRWARVSQEPARALPCDAGGRTSTGRSQPTGSVTAESVAIDDRHGHGAGASTTSNVLHIVADSLEERFEADADVHGRCRFRGSDKRHRIVARIDVSGGVESPLL